MRSTGRGEWRVDGEGWRERIQDSDRRSTKKEVRRIISVALM